MGDNVKTSCEHITHYGNGKLYQNHVVTKPLNLTAV